MKTANNNIDNIKNINNKKKFKFQEFIITLNTLDPQNIGSWPVQVKAFLYVLTFVLALALGYVLDIASVRENLKVGQHEQVLLLREFEQKAFKAQNLNTYQRQIKGMENSFTALLRQLPQDTEVPGLLEDITHAGLDSGVEFDSIDLGQEALHGFYVEQPINIKAHGDYHAFGTFISGTAALPRIVTLHDFKIEPEVSKDHSADNSNGSPILSLIIQAKTYRYNDTSVANDNKDKNNKTNKGSNDTQSPTKEGV